MARVAAVDAALLPQSLEAERALLGALLVDPDAIYAAQEVDLRAEDFWREADGWIYAAILDLANNYRTVDYISICDALAHRQNGHGSELEALGGPAALTAMMTECVTSAHAKEYAQIIKRRAQQRRIISACADIAELAQSLEGEELYDKASQAFFAAIETDSKGSHLFGGDEALLEYLERQAAREEELRESPDKLVHTGLPSLDGILGDILPAYLHTVVARTSVGKTMYLEQVAEYNAMRGQHVAYYHLELTHETMLHRCMVRRLLFGTAPGQVPRLITFDQLSHGYHGAEVAKTIDAIRPWFHRLTYVHCPGWSVERICADIVRLHAKGRCDLALVDYLQKLDLPSSHADMNVAQLYGVMANALKNVAERLEVPILLGSQVSRDYKTRGDKRPRAEDIRNSGMIEEMSSQIVVLHRPSDTEARDPQPLEAWVEKNTQGPLGKADLVHFPGRFLLASLDETEPIPPWWEEK